MTLIHGDCLDKLKELEQNSIDALLTDPPAGISFMGKAWDHDKGGRKQWIDWMTSVMKECLRVMKPGAHGLVWALPRTSHWTATALEDAGFEVRDVITHLFGQGFPKSLNVSKAIDKAAGAEREVIGINPSSRPNSKIKGNRGFDSGLGDGDSAGIQHLTAPSTDAAKQWDGWGTALKPASEHWILVRKPLDEKTVASNVLKYGTGAINIDASRVQYQSDSDKASATPQGKCTSQGLVGNNGKERNEFDRPELKGRFPANLVLSHHPDCLHVYPNGESGLFCVDDCAVKMLDEQSGISKITIRPPTGKPVYTGSLNNSNTMNGSITPDSTVRGVSDSGGASRFFYCAKVSTSERNAGLEEFEKKEAPLGDDRPSGQSMSRLDGRPPRLAQNTHPTVKPQKLMRYLIKLITPPNGIILDPFMGSGSTGIAAKENGFQFIGIEKELEYFEIAKKRISN